jgi:RHS repeat-associated protein
MYMKTNNRFLFSLIISGLMLLSLCFSGTEGYGQAFNFKTREASVIRTARQIKDHNGMLDTIIVRQDKWDEMRDNWGSWGTNLKFKSVHAFVKFYVNHAYPVKIHNPYTYRLSYKVYGFSNMADTTAYTTINDTLTISYKPDSLSAFQDVQYKKYTGFHKILVEMTGLYEISDANAPPVLVDLSSTGNFINFNFNVEGTILVQPYHKRVKNGTGYTDVYGGTNVFKVQSEPPVNDYMELRWNMPNNSITGALELTPANYELEWAYVDNYRVSNTGTVTEIPNTQLTYNFTNNSTRIWLDTNYYRIPMIYQKGYIVYRVRAVRPDSVNYKYPIYGAWSLANTGIISAAGAANYRQIQNAHLNDSLNWQYTVSFAEQGKHKQVLSYYDGMLKNRQSITRFNSMPNKLIATEQVYDYEGRPSISILPTPIPSNTFTYQSNLSLNAATNKPYKAGDFDYLSLTICPLDNTPSPLAIASPAYLYYSPSNPDKAGFQKFVPDAGGYPFVQTIYSPGYDERVEKQGGAGDSLQIGFKHNVKNDYVSAEQMDLNRLFGLDIGYAGFYRKTVSRDPNGQLSLNVTDYKGKTVTSSMVGFPDTAIHAILPNENLPDTSMYTEDFIAGTQQQYIGNKIILDKLFFNDANGNNTSRYIYKFTPWQTFCPGKFLSVKAAYKYSIINECGSIISQSSGGLGNTGVYTSGTATDFTSPLNAFVMDKGKHSVHKELTVNLDEVNKAVDSFLAMSPAQNCLKTEQQFIKEAVLSKQFPCPEAYADMDCNPCESKKKEMMEELWPNLDSMYVKHKYGIYRRNQGIVTGNDNSIFTVTCRSGISGQSVILSGSGRVTGGTWSGVGNPDNNQAVFGNGGAASGAFSMGIGIHFIDQANQDTFQCQYRYQDPCLVQLPASITKFGRVYTNLRSLPVDTFIYIFNDTIAEALLPLHPEYCKLLECSDDPFRKKMNNIPDGNIAAALNLLTIEQIIQADPLLASLPPGFVNPHDSLAYMAHGLISIDSLALMQAYCHCADSVMMQECLSQIFYQDIQNHNLMNDYVRKRYFEFAKALYFANRSKYIGYLQPNAFSGDCSTCQTRRMTLVPRPVFPNVLNPNGTLATGPGSFSAAAQSINPTAASSMLEYASILAYDPQNGYDSTEMQQSFDSAVSVYNSNNTALCAGPIDNIIGQLVNCADSITLAGVKTYLLNRCLSGQVAYGNYTPQQIRGALDSMGIALNDICNPYLINFDYLAPPDQQDGQFVCNSATFFQDATTTVNGNPKQALINPGTVYSYNLNTANQFDQGIRTALGNPANPVSVVAHYNATKALYILKFYKTAGDTTRVYFKGGTGSCANAFSQAGGTTVTIPELTCINNIYGGFSKGYIGKYAFAARVQRTTGGQSAQCILLGWTGEVAMNHEGENPIAEAIPCTQMKTLYQEFRDTMLSYAVKGLNHPYYNTMLRNYMNYRLKRSYTLEQYRDFIESCAVSDFIPMKQYQGYIIMTFELGSHCQNFINALNNFDPAVQVTVPYRLRTQYGEQIYFNLNEVPKNKLKKVLDFIRNYTGGIHPNNGRLINSIDPNVNFQGTVFLPDTTTFNPGAYIFNNAASSFTFTNHLPGQIEFWFGTGYRTCKMMLMNSPGGNTIAQNSYNMEVFEKYLRDNNIYGDFFPCSAPGISNQYTLPEKKAYLNYAYSFQSLSPNMVLDSLQAQFLESDISLFNGKRLGYGHPAQPGNINNLYLSNPATATSGTHYSKLDYILNTVSNYFSANHNIFFTGSNTRQILPANKLTAYRCADSAFWYRFFDNGDTLYNVFVRLPAYLDTAYLPGYQLAGITYNNGEQNSYSFKVQLQHVNPAVPFRNLTLDGYTDFVVARNMRLDNVLLAHQTTDPVPIADTVNNCERQLLNAAIYEGQVEYRLYIDSIRTRMRADFLAYIMTTGIKENLFVSYRNQRFNYTLYYYDRAGNLVRTIPPAGVVTLGNNLLNNVNAERDINGSSGSLYPGHTKPSDYKYNTLNQVFEQTTPDGGETQYFYDAAGRVIFSQNAKQRSTGDMTYTLYDKQGRIMETGQAKISCTPYFDPYNSPDVPGTGPCTYYDASLGQVTPFPYVVHNLKHIPHETVVSYVRALTRSEVVYTHYDASAVNLGSVPGMSAQENLRKRVSSIKYFDYLQPANTAFSGYTYAMHFSYDIAGNVKTLTRDYPGWALANQQYKRVDYDYDVISGKVNLLSYNRSFADQYYQRYGYDADNRITKVETSADGYIWKRDAEYQYYQHGPLARMSLGDLRIQGVDFAYTIQGWLKAVNGDMLDTTYDMGADAAGNSVHAHDAVALSLDYFKGDYKPIGNVQVKRTQPPLKNMYNGNIPQASTAIAPFPALSTAYVYDQLNRILKAQYAYVNPYNAELSNTADYRSTYAYDPDGNLKKLVRNGNAVGSATQLMDSLSYHYVPGGLNNQLRNVTDFVSNNSFHNDIKHYTNTGASRYLYDPTGNTIKDQVSGQDTILWNHYNKVVRTRNDSLDNGLVFAYDGAGNRYLKSVTRTDADTTLEKSDYYVRDAQGNILATYASEAKYVMTRQEWINTVNNAILAVNSKSIYLNNFIAPFFSQNGHFKASALQAMALATDWANATINAAPVSYFTVNSISARNNLLSHAGGTSTFFPVLAEYSTSKSKPVLGNAIYNGGFKDKDVCAHFFSYLLDPDSISLNMRKHVIGLLCNHSDSLLKRIQYDLGWAYDTSSCSANTTVLEQQLRDREMVADFVDRIVNNSKEERFRNDYWSMVKAITLDPQVLSYAPYADRGTRMSAFFNNTLQNHANDSLLGGFFDYWPQAPSALKSSNTTASLISVLYDANAASLLDNYTTYHGGSMSIVNNGLYMVPMLNVSDYLTYAGSALNFSLSYTTYANIMKAQRMYLSEHHLYGSSRLGIKSYLPAQHYLSWNNEGPVPVVDTTNLNARRPWYSMVYNDAINSLSTQPWGMTEQSSYYMQHVMGQKQYELTNHLGNVQATLSDYPMLRPIGEEDSIRQRNPAFVTAYDYYPFGMLMPGRGSDSILSISNVAGNILIETNEFNDNSIAGWQNYSGALSLVSSNGRLAVNCSGRWQGAQKPISVIPGRSYRLRLDMNKGSLSTGIQYSLLKSDPGGGWGGWAYLQTHYVTTVNGFEINFVAPTSSMKIIVEGDGNNPAANATFYIDNFILEEIKPQGSLPPTDGNGCITMTQTKWVTHMETYCYAPQNWPWPNFFVANGATATAGPSSVTFTATNSLGQGYVSFDIATIPDVSQDVIFNVTDVKGSANAQFFEDVDGTLVLLSSESVVKGSMKCSIKPTTGTVRVRIRGIYTGITFAGTCVTRPVLKQEHMLVDVCPEPKDRYRFGFNGQEKVNEWAGIGNFLDFTFRGYDSRIARFISKDPLSRQFPFYSEYQFAGNTPIAAIDIEGLEPTMPPKPGEIKTFQGKKYFHDENGYMFLAKSTNRSTGKPQNYWVHVMHAPNYNYIYQYHDGITWNQFFDENAFNHEQMKIRVASAETLQKGFAMMIGAFVAAPAVVQSGVGSAVYKGSAWLGRNYGWNFIKEVAKEGLANRGKWEKMDWHDIMVNTMTSKMGINGKIIGSGLNSLTDITVEKKIQSAFTLNKSAFNIMYDASFEALKLSVGELGKTNGVDETTQTSLDAGIDQIKAEASDIMEKKPASNGRQGQAVYGN